MNIIEANGEEVYIHPEYINTEICNEIKNEFQKREN